MWCPPVGAQGDEGDVGCPPSPPGFGAGMGRSGGRQSPSGPDYGSSTLFNRTWTEEAGSRVAIVRDRGDMGQSIPSGFWCETICPARDERRAGMNNAQQTVRRRVLPRFVRPRESTASLLHPLQGPTRGDGLPVPAQLDSVLTEAHEA